MSTPQVNRFNKDKYLARCVEERLMFIDTCSLASPSAAAFWQRIIPLLRQMGRKIIIPARCVDELRGLGKARKPDSPRARVARAFVLKQLKAQQLVDIRGEETERRLRADNVFLNVFQQARNFYKLLLITQDADLARDILALNRQESARGEYIYVCQLDAEGYLEAWRFEDAPGAPTKAPARAFRRCMKVTERPNEPLNISSIPEEGDTVYDDSNNAFRLESVLAAGGEGIVYRLNQQGFVAKIYKPSALTSLRYEKLRRMVSVPLYHPGICYPMALLFNENGEFVGYMMCEGRGYPLKSIFTPPKLARRFPCWTKKDTVQLCLTILDKIRFLHDNNIILGDINAGNILVESPERVSFVDTDSYQIEDIPCPVGTPHFTPPEIHARKGADNFSSFLRTREDEAFAVATLLFMIMLPGKSPYAQQGGGLASENIRAMEFPYPCGERSNKKAPEGPWSKIWSHMLYRVKEAFYETFSKDGKYAQPKKRLSVAKWQEIFRDYREHLLNGNLESNDPMSMELFPTRYKKHTSESYITCSLCGNEAAERFCHNGICPECSKKRSLITEARICSRCGEQFNVSLKTLDWLESNGKNPPRFCNTCRALLYTVAYSKPCEKCGSSITLTRAEVDSLTRRGKHLPTLCRSCFAQSRAVAYSHSCEECGELIELNQFQVDNHLQKGWKLPTLCQDCKNRLRSEAAARKSEAERRRAIAYSHHCDVCGSQRIEFTQAKVDAYRQNGWKLPTICFSCKEQLRSQKTSTYQPQTILDRLFGRIFG